MKKLLLSLATITLTSSVASNVVSCFSKDDNNIEAPKQFVKFDSFFDFLQEQNKHSDYFRVYLSITWADFESQLFLHKDEPDNYPWTNSLGYFIGNNSAAGLGGLREIPEKVTEKHLFSFYDKKQDSFYTESDSLRCFWYYETGYFGDVENEVYNANGTHETINGNNYYGLEFNLSDPNVALLKSEQHWIEMDIFNATDEFDIKTENGKPYEALYIPFWVDKYSSEMTDIPSETMEEWWTKITNVRPNV